METIETKLFNETVKDIEKKYGKGSITTANIDQVDVLSTGSISLDAALGIKGFPRGRIIEIYGNESSGKTTIALQAVAKCLEENKKAAYIDAENSLDINYLISMGIDPEKLLLARPESGEQAFNIIDALIKTKLIDLIVVDSVAALIPESELNGDVSDQNIGAHARLMSKGLRMIQSSISKSNVCIIFINQLREKVGIMFGNPETTTGGRALKFYSSVRLDVRRIESLKQSGEVMGNRTRVKVVKNKIAPPFKEAEFDIMFGEGISAVGDILDLAANENIVSKSGAWYAYNGNKIGQGRENAKQYLRDNPEICNEIEIKVRAHFGLQGVDENASQPETADVKPKAKSAKAAEKAEEKAE